MFPRHTEGISEGGLRVLIAHALGQLLESPCLISRFSLPRIRPRLSCIALRKSGVGTSPSHAFWIILILCPLPQTEQSLLPSHKKKGDSSVKQ